MSLQKVTYIRLGIFLLHSKNKTISTSCVCAGGGERREIHVTNAYVSLSRSPIRLWTPSQGISAVVSRWIIARIHHNRSYRMMFSSLGATIFLLIESKFEIAFGVINRLPILLFVSLIWEKINFEFVILMNSAKNHPRSVAFPKGKRETENRKKKSLIFLFNRNAVVRTSIIFGRNRNEWSGNGCSAAETCRAKAAIQDGRRAMLSLRKNQVEKGWFHSFNYSLVIFYWTINNPQVRDRL